MDYQASQSVESSQYPGILQPTVGKGIMLHVYQEKEKEEEGRDWLVGNL